MPTLDRRKINSLITYLGTIEIACRDPLESSHSEYYAALPWNQQEEGRSVLLITANALKKVQEELQKKPFCLKRK